MISAAPLIKALIATAPAAYGLLADRIYQDEAPQDVVFPCATFICIFDDPQNHLRGRAQLKRQRWQVDIWCESHAEADAAAEVVQAALQHGSIEAALAYLGEPVLLADNVNQRYGVAAPYSVVMNETRPSYEKDSGLRRFLMDFTIWFY